MQKRTIRSFVRRQGRMTEGQKLALEELWPRYGLEPKPEEHLNFNAIFSREAPTVLEIGFGNGESLATQAQCAPEMNFIGIEVHRPGVGHLLKKLDEYDCQNCRVICTDAVDIVQNNILENSLAKIQVFFPDPWPKKKHNKRRIIQPAFVELLASRLQEGGLLHLATDWQPYAEHMMEVMNASSLQNTVAEYSDRLERPQTKFENRGLKLGHGVWDLVFIKRP